MFPDFFKLIVLVSQVFLPNNCAVVAVAVVVVGGNFTLDKTFRLGRGAREEWYREAERPLREGRAGGARLLDNILFGCAYQRRELSGLHAPLEILWTLEFAFDVRR